MCLAAKPSVDRLEATLLNEVQFVRVDIGSRVGREVVRLYNVTATPTYIVLSGSGDVIYRQVGGFPNGSAAKRALDDSV